MTWHRDFVPTVRRTASLLARGSVFLLALFVAASGAAVLISSTASRHTACDASESVGAQESTALTEDQAAGLVFRRWLDGHMLQHLCSGAPSWITGYSVDEAPRRFRDSTGAAYPVYVTTFSVRPLSPLDGSWNGAGVPADGGWVRHKTIFFTVDRDGDRLVFHEHGTSPV